ncbi:MarR family winged helix-turn-helix transcriptional regulator [Marinomonas pollencensis]|uniref:DNA-binding MarR family transcriptional regulator n=1 Tax=Marinomonas pollencensis TaxID=491954 RepID=A0A3E0DSR3_9GAMM|nr:MarR family winged helix-turn-helix transcriptional regulator [Marinomonas pollencensis]REG85523.1 DNA-binding MarR family transcriptional regulator [Marinomonas pollencensis]
MSLNLDESLHRLIHCYKSEIKNAITESNLSLHVGHIRALKCIQRIPNCSAQIISKKMNLDKSQIARIIKELQTKGHIEKHPNPDNHRSQLLVLTEQGKQAIDTITTLDGETSLKMTNGLTEQQIHDFKHYVEIMTKNLCA